jgi:hypothetical protein
MPPRDPFIRIPRRTLDPRTCIRRRWPNGVGLDASSDSLWPHAIISDGDGGAYAVTSGFSMASNAFEIKLHHVDVSGVKSGPTLVASFNGHPVPKLLSSRNGSCIVIWTFRGIAQPLLAQRFDAQCNPVWTTPVELASLVGGFYAVGAGEDGAGGAVVVFIRGAGNYEYRIQNVNAAGTLQWGISGKPLPLPFISFANNVSQSIVPVGNGFALVWVDYVPVVGTLKGLWLDGNGQVTAGPFEIAATGEAWWDLSGVHRVVSDSTNGFWVAAAPAAGGQLRLLRFDSDAVLPATTVASRTLAIPESYAIAADGRGGVFVAAVGPGGSVTLDHLNASGAAVWANRPGFASIAVANLPSQSILAFDPASARLVSVAARDPNSAIVVYENKGLNSRIRSRCIDSLGRAFGPDIDVAGTPGNHSFALLNPPFVPTGPAQLIPPGQPIPPPDSDTARCTWLTTSGANTNTVSAQKIGCCPEVFDVDLVPNPFSFTCAVPSDSPTTPGAFALSFPCRIESGGAFGMLSLPQLARIPGLTLPGSLVSPTVPPPDWVRLVFSRVPDDVRLQLYAHTGERIAVAKAIPGGMEPATVELTFKPKAKLGYLLAFIRNDADSSSASIRVGVNARFGNGRPPAWPNREGPPTDRQIRKKRKSRRSKK